MSKARKIHIKNISLILVLVIATINLNMVKPKANGTIEVKSDWILSNDVDLDYLTITEGNFDTNNYKLTVKQFNQKGGKSFLRGVNTTINGGMTIENGEVQIYDNLTINGDLNISGGIFKLNGANLTVNGNVNISGGQVDFGKGNVYIKVRTYYNSGYLNFTNGTLDLNGANLNIDKDLNQIGGAYNGTSSSGSILYVNEGNINIGENYMLADFSRLVMKNPKDFVLIKKNFTINTYSIHKDILSDGVIEIKGDFRQLNYSKKYTVAGQELLLEYKDNFQPQGNHKFIFSGDSNSKQTIAIDYDNASKFNVLEVKGSILNDYYLVNVRWNKLIENVKASNNADLTSIAINGHKVENFSSNSINYNMVLPMNTQKELLYVIADTADANATIAIEGNKVVNNAALVTVTVTAADKITKKVYYINVQLKESFEGNEFSRIESGDFHSLILKSDGTLYAWGTNDYGQLGDGYTRTRLTPVQVRNISNVIDFDTSNSHSIALTADGYVWVWGMNDFGQLKSNTRENILLPIKIKEIDHIKKVKAGERYSLALDNSGMVWQWGYNSSGQYGDENEEYSLKPKAIEEFLNIKIKDIAAGSFHNLALSEEGKVYAWGANDNGQIGDGTLNAKLKPVEIPGLDRVKAVFANGNSSAVIKEDGTVLYWGESNFSTETSIKIPKLISDVKDVVDIDLKSNHITFIKNDGKAFSLGLNTYGQLGDGTYSNKSNPIEIKGLKDVKNIAVSLYNTFIVTQGGNAYSLGRNDIGQLGINSAGGNYSVPQQISDLTSGVSMVYANYNSGFVNKYTSIKLTTDTMGASVYYTLDGSEPNENSNLYKSPITITDSTKIKAIAVKYNNRSAVSSFEYIIRQVPSEEVNVSIDSKQTKSGSTIEIPIYFSKVPLRGIAAAKFVIKYNPNILELQSVTSGAIIKESKELTYSSLSPDKLLLSFSDESRTLRNINKDGTFAILKFKIKDGTSDGRYLIEKDFYNLETMHDSNRNDIRFIAKEGYVDVKNLIYGDVDGDEKVTARDLQYLQRYIAKTIASFPWSKGLEAADINKDGNIDEKDVELLKKNILN